MTNVELVITCISALIAVCILIAVTVASVRSFHRGESIRKVMKTWFSRMIDAIFGIG